MNTSTLPWWGWILLGIGAGLVRFITATVYEDKKADTKISNSVATISSISILVAGFSTLVGLILFVKWVWIWP